MKLAKLVEEILELPAGVNLSVAVMHNTVWYYEDDELYVNTDGSIKDLFNHDGDTYNWSVRGCVESEDGYTLFEQCDSQQGWTISIILPTSEQCDNDEA